MLIRGDRLDESQRRQVLAAYVHRWTHENAVQTYGGRCPACVQGGSDASTDIMPDGRTWHEHHNPLISDGEWLAKHAFRFIKDGSRLSECMRGAVPASMADAS